jgi:hypothetical protein
MAHSEMAHSIAETTGGAGALLPSPSAADSGSKTASIEAAPVKTEQPDTATPAPKSRTAKKKPTRNFDTAQVYTTPDGPVHRPGSGALASFGGWNGFWGGNDLNHAATCFPSASAVRQGHPKEWPSWTLRAPGHEGTKCWYAATRATARDHW